MQSSNPSSTRLLNEFDRVAGRVLQTSDAEARQNIRRLLAFLSSTPPLAEAILAAPRPQPFSGLGLINALYRGDFHLPTDSEGELGTVVAMLRVIEADADQVGFWNYTINLPPVTDVNEQAREFMRRYVHPSILYLRQLLVDHLPEPESTLPISVNVLTQPGGISQTNIAQQGGQIHAHQSAIINVPEIRTAVETLLATLSAQGAEAIPTEVRKDLEECGTLVVHEINQPDPEPSRLRGLGKRLMRTVEVINASDAVYQAGSALVNLLLRLQV